MFLPPLFHIDVITLSPLFDSHLLAISALSFIFDAFADAAFAISMPPLRRFRHFSAADIAATPPVDDAADACCMPRAMPPRRRRHADTHDDASAAADAAAIMASDITLILLLSLRLRRGAIRFFTADYAPPLRHYADADI